MKGLSPVLHSCGEIPSPTGKEQNHDVSAWNAAPPFTWGKEAAGPPRCLEYHISTNAEIIEMLAGLQLLAPLFLLTTLQPLCQGKC